MALTCPTLEWLNGDFYRLRKQVRCQADPRIRPPSPIQEMMVTN
jgi:hypothetical protein